MSFTPPSLELAWMESHPQQFTRLAGVPGTWGLFEVIRAMIYIATPPWPCAG